MTLEQAEKQSAERGEPVAYRVWHRMGGISYRHTKPSESEYVEWDALYTEPPKREWVGLSRDEVLDIEESTTHPLEFYRAIEAKLKEKNT